MEFSRCRVIIPQTAQRPEQLIRHEAEKRHQPRHHDRRARRRCLPPADDEHQVHMTIAPRNSRIGPNAALAFTVNML